ncbi:MAG: LysE family translocator [Hyphomicrobiaceae bacterium]
MNLEWILAVAAFCLVTCFTPGPNNTMLMASGLNYGFGRTLPHMLGVALGFTGMVLAVAFGIAKVFEWVPALYVALKVVSVAYLLWLAWKIATATPKVDGATGGRPLSFIEAAAFQWVNPKAWIMAVGASAAYIVASAPVASVIAISSMFLVVGLGSSATWVVGGTALRRLIGNPVAIRAINIALALLLVGSLWPIVAEIDLAALARRIAG